MYNPIEEKRRFVQAQIQKSFDSGINLSEEMSLEKAWNVGDEKQYQGVTYYVAGLNAKGKPLWRKKKDGGSAKNQTSTPAPRKPGSVDNKFKNVEFHHGQYYFNMGVDKHNYVILKKLSDKQVAKYKEYQEKRNKDALDAAISQAINDWKNTTNVDTPKKEKAWKKIVDEISVKRAHGYALTNEENYYWGMEQGGKRADSSTLLSFRKPDKVSEKEGSALMGKLMEAWELDSNHSFGERKKWESKLVETLNKMGKSAEWFNENAEVIANADTGEYDDELEKLYDVNGIDDLFDLVREIGDDTENEPDNNDVIDSSNVGEKIISALKADQGGLNNSSAGKKAQMKIVAAAENFMKKNPKVKLSDEDLENIVGGDIDEVEEKYGELKGWNELNDSIELYFDAPIDDDTTGLDAAENKIANSKLDSKEKSASSNIRNRIISALKTSQVRLMNSSVGKEERMKMITAVENFMKENPKVDFSDDDLVNIVFGNIDDFEEDYGELKGWDDLKKVQIAYKKALLSNSISDPRDKIAQDGGFKDYEEMKGYQDYVTQKNLLKKKSTKAGMRLLYQQEVAKYEKDHADLIKRIGSNN